MRRFDFAIRWVAFFLLVIPALIRLCVLVHPDPFFAVDPRLIPIPPDGFGPSGSLFLDGLSLMGFGLSLIAERRAGRGLDWKLIGLGVVPLVSIGLAGWSDSDQMLTGSHWFAAVATGLGAAHLGRDGPMRMMMIAAVMAMAVPLVTKAVYQVTVEHPMLVMEYEQTGEMVAQAHGWEVGSVQEKLYTRRLEQNEATGWFGLSNVFGSLLAGLAAFWITAVLAGARTKLSSGWIGLLGLVAIGLMAGVAVTFSKGAIAVTVLGIVLAGLALLPRRHLRVVRGWSARVAFGLVVFALLAVVFRGVVFGERLTADGYSLLFRWHYWQGAFHLFVEHPVFGVGPDGFKAAYMIFKPAVSPEEVTVPHSVLITWVSTLGVFGLGWVGLFFVLVFRASPSAVQVEDGRSGSVNERDGITDRSERIWWVVVAGVIGFVVFLVSTLAAGSSMFPDFKWVFWPMSWAGFVGLMAALPWIGRHSSWALLRWGVWVSLVVVVVHSQIEMTMSVAGSASLIWLLLGAAAVKTVVSSERNSLVSSRSQSTATPSPSPSLTLRPGSGQGGRGIGTESSTGCGASPPGQTGWKPVLLGWGSGDQRYWADLGFGALVVLFAVCFFVFVWWPVSVQQSHVRRAAERLADVGRVNQELADGAAGQTPAAFVDGIEEAAGHLSSCGFDPRIDGMVRQVRSALGSGDQARVQRLRNEIMFAIDQATIQLELARSVEAIAELETAAKLLATDDLPLHEMAGIWIRLAWLHHRLGDLDGCDEALAVAGEIAHSMIQRRPKQASSYSFGAGIGLERYQLLADSAALDEAIGFQETACSLDPYGLRAAQQMALLLELAERSDESVRWYRRVLEIDGLLSLDPLKQLTEEERADVVRWIERLGGG